MACTSTPSESGAIVKPDMIMAGVAATARPAGSNGQTAKGRLASLHRSESRQPANRGRKAIEPDEEACTDQE